MFNPQLNRRFQTKIFTFENTFVNDKSLEFTQFLDTIKKLLTESKKQPGGLNSAFGSVLNFLTRIGNIDIEKDILLPLQQEEIPSYSLTNFIPSPRDKGSTFITQ